MVPELKELPYEERLQKLKLPSLAYRRSRGDLIEAFKILTDKYDPECTRGLFTMRESEGTRGNSRKIFKPRIRLDLRKYSFPIRIINNWNSLPEWVVSAGSVESFEARLDKFWEHQDQKYNYKAQITTTISHQILSNRTQDLETQA